MSASALPKHALAGKKIVVVGAGIAGLAFARSIHLNWPSQHPKPEIVLYERSSEIVDVGREGYTMGIRSDGKSGGLLALQKLGLSDLAIQNSTAGGQTMPGFWTKDWKVMLKSPTTTPPAGQLPSSIRLVRHVLRTILLDALPHDTKLHYSTGIESTSLLPSGKIHLTLSNSTTTTCDLLIAADGANSTLRTTLLPTETLTYAGVNIYMGTSRFPNGKPPLLAKDWGMSISGQGIPFLTFPVDATTGVWALSYRSPTQGPRIKGQAAKEKYDEILAEVKAKGSMFAQPFGEFVDATDPETLQVFNAMQKYPVAHSRGLLGEWYGRVVFLGDANHAMSPFSGNGANMALMDGWELGRRLAGVEGEGMGEVVEGFDGEAIPRSKKAIDSSWYVIRLLHVKGWWFMVMRGLLAVLNWFVNRKST